MNEIDLKQLSRLKTPRPDETARGNAVERAMLAFDEAGDEEKSTATQGSVSALRPISTIPTLWSNIMSIFSKPLSPSTMALMTGVCLLPIAGVVTWNVFDRDPLGRLQVPQVEQEAEQVAETTSPVSKQAVAADRLGDVQDTEIASRVAQAPMDAKDETVADASKRDDAQMLSEAEAKQVPSVKKKARADESKRLTEVGASGLQGQAATSPAQGEIRKQPEAKLLRRARERASGLKRTKEQFPVAALVLPVKPATPNMGSADNLVQREIVAPVPQPVEADRENYTDFDDDAVKSVSTEPVSTFSIDVDTAAYARVRRALTAGTLPPKGMVRVEEMVNYFSYDYPLPESREQPFKSTVTVIPTPWNESTQLMHIGIKGFDVPQATQPKANLVFLLDVSGSMRSPDKLPLLIKSFRLLLQKLNPDDTVSIVTYAGRSATVLEPTKAADRNKIVNVLENLRAGGSTAGAQGIEQAYRLAQQNFVEGGVNRVMLATDGDFNVGISDPEQLKDFIAEKRKSGIFLSIFGFGAGNYNDALMQSLAQNGNGTAAYIDTLLEARKVLVEEAGGTLFPIATDVKIQMEFNPAKIAEYRLIGYETRALKREDFNNDKVDAGDIGSGHTVTAIYELTPIGSEAVLNTPLRYKKTKPETAAAMDASDEIGFLKMRYKLPGESKSKLIEMPITDAQAVDGFEKASSDTRFSIAVASFGQKLRGNDALDGWGWDAIASAAKAASGGDPFGYRNEFAQLVRLAGALAPDPKTVSAPKE